MESSIFRRYDLRGRYPDDFTSADFEKIAQEFGKMFPEGSSLAVGFDARLSGPELELHACRGLEALGHLVHRLGMVPTPLCYFHVCVNNLDGAIMITSSHNPKDWNGAKLMREKAICLTWEDGIEELQDKAVSAQKEIQTSSSGSSVNVNSQDAYVQHVTSAMQVNSDLHVVVECSNGASGPILRRLLERLEVSFELVNDKPDGNFPAHEPDVFLEEVENIVANRILDVDADVGFAIDGDGDRLRMFDNHGEPIPNDMLTAWLAEQILKNHPGSTILHEVRTGLSVDKFIRELGGDVALCKSGHSYVMAELMRLYPKSYFAGELTGHYFYAENYFFDDALFALGKALEALSAKEKPISLLHNEFPKIEEIPTQKMEVPDAIKHQAVENLVPALAHLEGKASTLDGLRLDFDDAFILVRAKNTEAAIETRFQAETHNRLLALRKEVLGALEDILQQLDGS
ncbi:MAG: phosphomannomutase/phosphoglucomutase [Candidatus Hodarchaeales archaeon]